MKSEESIRQTLTEIVIDVLGVEREEIKPTARFFADLGGESIDMLELSFQCEKHFGVKVEIQKAIPLDAIATDGKGRLTPASLKQLKSRLSALVFEKDRQDVTVDDVRDAITIETIAQLILATLTAAEAGRGLTPKPV